MRRALVTGGAGFIGSALVRLLAESGYHVRVYDDLHRGGPRTSGGPRRSSSVATLRDVEALGRATRPVVTSAEPAVPLEAGLRRTYEWFSSLRAAVASPSARTRA